MWIDFEKAGISPGPVDGAQDLGRGKVTVNPMLRIYGKGPEGRACGDCQHFLRLLRGNKSVRKCELRSLSHSEASDHRAGWMACGSFEEAEDD